MAELSVLDISVCSIVDLIRMLLVQDIENLRHMGLNDYLTQKVLMSELLLVSLKSSQMSVMSIG